MSSAVRPRPPRGRPRRETLEAREHHLLDTAAQLFLEHGYGATTLDAVVAAAGVSKRTLYQRYADKATLFGAVLEHIIGQLRPPSNVPLVLGANLAEVLERLAGFMVHAALQPAAQALHRLLTAESARFPEIGQMLAANGNVQLANSLVAGLLMQQAGQPDSLVPAGLADERAQLLAAQFLTLVVTHPRNAATGLAPPMTPAQLAEWPRACVALFLHGVAGAGKLPPA